MNLVPNSDNIQDVGDDAQSNVPTGRALRTLVVVLMLSMLPVIGVLVYLNLNKAKEVQVPDQVVDADAKQTQGAVP